MLMQVSPRSKYGRLPDRKAGVRDKGNTPGDHGHYATRTNSPAGHSKGLIHPIGFSGRTIGHLTHRFRPGRA